MSIYFPLQNSTDHQTTTYKQKKKKNRKDRKSKKYEDNDDYVNNYNSYNSNRGDFSQGDLHNQVSDVNQDFNGEYNNEDGWDEYWAKNGEILVYQRWVEKYGEYISYETIDSNLPMPAAIEVEVTANEMEEQADDATNQSQERVIENYDVGEDVVHENIRIDTASSNLSDTSDVVCHEKSLTGSNASDLCPNKDSSHNHETEQMINKRDMTGEENSAELTENDTKLVQMFHDYDSTGEVVEKYENSYESSEYEEYNENDREDSGNVWKTLWEEHYTEMYWYYHNQYQTWGGKIPDDQFSEEALIYVDNDGKVHEMTVEEYHSLVQSADNTSANLTDANSCSVDATIASEHNDDTSCMTSKVNSEETAMPLIKSDVTTTFMDDVDTNRTLLDVTKTTPDNVEEITTLMNNVNHSENASLDRHDPDSITKEVNHLLQDKLHLYNNCSNQPQTDNESKTENASLGTNCEPIPDNDSSTDMDSGCGDNGEPCDGKSGNRKRSKNSTAGNTRGALCVSLCYFVKYS